MSSPAPRLTVLANRAPYHYTAQGWRPSVGGLTTALDPVMTRQGGTWLALGAEGQQAVPLPPGQETYTLHPVTVPPEQAALYYSDLSNGTLWPLCHGFLERTEYDPAAWRAYEEVNFQFALAAVENAQPGEVFWVNDYHLALVPKFIRSMNPQARIGLFWHIPWPSVDMLGTLPWRDLLLRGVLNADVIGVHTERDADKLVRAAGEWLCAAPMPGGLRYQGRQVEVQVNPISVDTRHFSAARHDPQVRGAAQQLKDDLGTKLLLGVDRLDYSKGLPQRLRAFERLLEGHPELRGGVTLMQVAAPSREDIAGYAEQKAEVEGLVGHINGR